jgi:hypothetical protein
MQLENWTALTLSLSPRRGNSLRPCWDESLDGEVIRSARELLPLPGGEGWGEGERLVRLNRSGAAASATSAHAGESPAGRIGRFTTDSPMPVPPRGWEGRAVWELNRQAVMKMNHIQ